MSGAMEAIDDYVDLLLTPVEPMIVAAPEPPAPAAVAPTQAGAPPVPPPAPSAPIAPSGPAVPATRPAMHPMALQPPPEAAEAAEAAAPAPAPAPLARWLRLDCGGQTYALELLKIREVVLPAPLLPLRGAAAAVRGVMNLRGQVVPVLDLGLHFSGVRLEATSATRIVVLEERNEVIGLQVSAVEDIVLLDEASVENPRASRLAPVGDQRIRGIARLGGRVMLLLDGSRLLATPLH